MFQFVLRSARHKNTYNHQKVQLHIGSNFHMICEAQTLGNSINVGLHVRASYLSVRTAGGASGKR